MGGPCVAHLERELIQIHMTEKPLWVGAPNTRALQDGTGGKVLRMAKTRGLRGAGKYKSIL